MKKLIFLALLSTACEEDLTYGGNYAISFDLTKNNCEVAADEYYHDVLSLKSVDEDETKFEGYFKMTNAHFALFRANFENTDDYDIAGFGNIKLNNLDVLAILVGKINHNEIYSDAENQESGLLYFWGNPAYDKGLKNLSVKEKLKLLKNEPLFCELLYSFTGYKID